MITSCCRNMMVFRQLSSGQHLNVLYSSCSQVKFMSRCVTSHALHTSSFLEKGHSHWQNVKKDKMAGGNQKALQTRIALREVRFAFVSGGKNPDPSVNVQLARAYDRAMKNNVRSEVLKRALARLADKGASSKNTFQGFRFIKGCCTILELECDKPKTLIHDLRSVMKKKGIRPTSEDLHSVLKPFDEKGMVDMTPTDKNPDAESAIDLAIEVGAEDVTDALNDDDEPTLRFICELRELSNVRNGLEQAGCEVTASTIGYLPQSFVQLNSAEYAEVSDMLSALMEFDEVVRIYTNIQCIEDEGVKEEVKQ